MSSLLHTIVNQPLSSERSRRTRTGNTLVLVTAILVLLVIIATAFISRTQGGRSVTAAQQRAFQREDHAQLVGEQVAAEVAQALFPKPIDPRFQAVADGYATNVEDTASIEDWLLEGGSTGVLAASVWSGTPRTKPGIDPSLYFTAERYQPDPGDYVIYDPATGGFTLPNPEPGIPATPADGVPDGFFDFNYAPYEVRPFTNWPDEFGDNPDDPFVAAQNPLRVPTGPGAPFGQLTDVNDLPLGAGNPLGNPGYGDFRLLRDSEPRRMGFYYDGPSPEDEGVFPNADPWSEYFTHWTHLSWLPTAENGWRVCYNIANVSPLDMQSYIDGTPVGPENGNTLSSYAFDDPNFELYRDIQFPAALQTPYEQWYPNVQPRSVEPLFDGNTFRLNDDRGSDWFAQRREEWFGTPRAHFEAALNPFDVLPNFINLNRLTYAEQFMRRRGIENDDAQSLDIADQLRNLKREVERTYCDTDGDGFTDSFWFVPPTPVDRGVRQVVGISVVDNGGMIDANVATSFDRWSTSGTTPSDLALVSRLRVQDDSGNSDFDTEDTHVGLFVDPKNTVDGLQNGETIPFFEQASGRYLAQRYRPERWFADDFSDAPTFLNMRGISELRSSASNGGFGPFYGEYQAVQRGNTFKDLPETAEQERRLWNRAAQRDGEGFYIRNDDTSGGTKAVLVPFSATPFTISDEMELRAFSGQNHPYTYSRFERAVDDSVSVGNTNNYYEGTLNSVLRSALDRPETTPIKTYPYQFSGLPIEQNGGLGNPSTGTLSNQQLARDLRHRVTLFSGARNELRPLWLWATPFFATDFDYDENGFTGEDLDYQEYERRKRKIDLRQSYALPTDITGVEIEGNHFTLDYFDLRYPARQGSWGWFQNQQRWLNDLQRTIGLTMAYKEDVSDDTTWQSYFSSPIFGLDTNDRFQTNPYLAYVRTLLASASMTANIESYRDGPDQPYNVFQDGEDDNTVFVDPPLHPLRARRTETVYAADEVREDTDPVYEEEGFIGLEKQPFITQVYTGLIYPKSQHGVGPRPNEGPLSDDSIIDNTPEWPSGFDIPEQFNNEAYLDTEQGDTSDPSNQSGNRNYVDNSSKPAIVLAIQIANPFNEPVSLADYCIRIGDYTGADNDGDENEYLWFAEMACPHSIIQPGHVDEDPDTPKSGNNGYFVNDLMLGPTEPDAPRTAIIFAVIPPSRSGGVGGPGSGADPDAWVGSSWSSEDFDSVEYAQFRDAWLDELDLEPGNLFGYEKDMPLRYHQTLVFDVSKMLHEDLPSSHDDRLEALFDDDNDRFFELIRQVDEPTISRYIEANGEDAVRNRYVPETWNEQDVLNLTRAEIVVDRLKHERDGNDGQNQNQDPDPREFDFLNTLSRMIPSGTAVGTGYDNRFVPPQVENDIDNWRNFELDPDALIDSNNNGEPDGIESDLDNRWAGIHIGSDDFYLTWSRVSRLWGWDLDGSGIFDVDETSPRYVFSLNSAPTSSKPDLFYSRFDPDNDDKLIDFVDVTDPDLEDMRRRRLPGVLRGNGGFNVWEGNVTTELARSPGKIPEQAQPDPQLDMEVVYGFRGDTFDTASFTSQTDDTNEGPFLMDSVERVMPVAKADVDRPWWAHGKPTNFTTWSALTTQEGDDVTAIERIAVDGLDFPIGVYPSSGDWENAATGYSLDIRFGGFEQDFGFVPMDLGATRQSDFDGGFRRELWGNSLQMLLKDNDIEQIGELANVFMWGPVLQLPDAPITKANFLDDFTFQDDNYPGVNPWDQWKLMPHPIGDEENGFAVKRTFAEVMTEIAMHQDYLNSENLDDGGRGLPDAFADDYSVGSGPLVNRINIDLGYNNAEGDFLNERPWRQVIGGTRFSSVPAFRPKLPAGVGLFDAVTVDGRGINASHPDLDNDGIYLANEALRAEVDRYDLVRGYSKNPTKGLLNINTASLEALRCLPQMSRLVYNDYFENDAFADFRGRQSRSATWTPRGETLYGHDNSGAQPYSNQKHVRLAESIERYRLGDAMDRRTKDFRSNVPEDERWIPQPSMADRGFTGIDFGDIDTNDVRFDDIENYYGYFPGMRNDRGLVSIGELLTMQRTSNEEFDLINGTEDGPEFGGWIYRSASVRGLGNQPYGSQGTNTSFARSLFHLGHRAVAGEEFPYPNNGGGLITSSQADTRVSTDRNNLRRTLLGRKKVLPYSNPSQLPANVPLTEFAPDDVASDSEELNMLFSGMANMITTRSDVFTIYMTIRTFTQDQATGIWDASSAANVIDESRYVMVIDRSQVEAPTDKPRILAFSKVE